MKQHQIAETGIIILALVLVYHFILSIFDAIAGLFISRLGLAGDLAFPFVLGIIFPVFLYLAILYLLITYKKPLAKWMSRNNEEEIAGISISGFSALHITLITLCLITIIHELPFIVTLLTELFTKKETYEDSQNGLIIQDSIETAAFLSPVVKIVAALLLLIFSKRVSSAWYKKNTIEQQD